MRPVESDADTEVDTGLLRVIQLFCRRLRSEAGLEITPSQVITLVNAIAEIAPPDLGDLYWCGRITLGVAPERVADYDLIFRSVFVADDDAPPLPPRTSSVEQTERDGEGGPVVLASLPMMVDRPGSDGQDEDDVEPTGSEVSSIEILRFTPFASCSPEEQALLRSLVRQLRPSFPTRRVRRSAPSQRPARIDLRRTARAALRQRDELTLRWRDRRHEPRRLLIMLDVSRSMAPYSRLALHFAHAMSMSLPRVEVVCFGTRITRVTRLIRKNRTEAALEAAAESVLDWDGGTRLGESIRAVQAESALRGALRGAVVLIVSDGLEQDDPRLLGEMLRRLKRNCHSLVWGNPLAGDPRYQPLTGGMLAALPYIDLLCPADTLAAFEGLVGSLCELSRVDEWRGRAGSHGSLTSGIATIGS